MPFRAPPVPPTELLVALPYDDAPTAALRDVGVAVISHPDLRWKRCDVKSTNLLGNVLANEAAHAAGAYEAILHDESGRATEATHSSLLWVRGETLYGSPEGNEILPGTTRHLMLDLARDANIPFHAEHVSIDDLKSMDEVIITGTTIEVMPVIRIDEAAIGSGRPGPVARRMQAAFRAAIDAWLESQSP